MHDALCRLVWHDRKSGGFKAAKEPNKCNDTQGKCHRPTRCRPAGNRITIDHKALTKPCTRNSYKQGVRLINELFTALQGVNFA